MASKSIFISLLSMIKMFFSRTSGVFKPHGQLTDEVSEYKKEILSDLDLKHPKEDKQNLRRDFNSVKSDFHNALDAYRSEYVNG